MIIVYKQAVDMRKQANGLALIIEQGIRLNIFDGGLFVFLNRDRTIIRIVYWDKSGFATWSKKLEKAKYPWPERKEDGSVEITAKELQWILDGLDYWKIKPHKNLEYTRVL